MKYFTLKYLKISRKFWKKFHGNFEIFQDPSLKHFVKVLIFIIKWLRTFINMIKVYEVSRKYIMLFMHNNRCLPLTGLLTLLQWTVQPAPIVYREIFEIFQKYFTKYFTKCFTPKNFVRFYIARHTHGTTMQTDVKQIYTVGHKKHQNTFVHNFSKCWPILIEIGVQCLG